MTLADVVFAKKWELDALRPALRPDALDGLDHAQRIDITYTSNAIEGNTLTAGETALILEKGITVAGKPLKDHLEAVDHAKALDWVLGISKNETAVGDSELRNLHRLAMGQSTPGNAGRYADRPRFVNTSSGVCDFPAPADVPTLMKQYCAWLAEAQNDPASAFEAHLRLVSIHPFNDGNGRTARLLMNLILARAGFPPIAVRPEDRPAYLAALETAQAGKADQDFNDLLFRRLDQTLDIYLAAARQAHDAPAEAAPQRT